MAITLKAARVNAGLTQKEASEKLGISKVTLSNWETGKTSPRADQSRVLSEIYGVSLDELIFLNPKSRIS